MGLDATKPFIGASTKVMLIQSFSSIETSLKIETTLVTTLDMMLSNKWITKAVVKLCWCTGWSELLLFAYHPRPVFSDQGLYVLGAQKNHLIDRVLWSTHTIRLFLFDLILYVPSTIFQLYRYGYSWVEPVQSWDKCFLLKDHNAVKPIMLEPDTLRFRVKHSTTEPQRSLKHTFWFRNKKTNNQLHTFI